MKMPKYKSVLGLSVHEHMFDFVDLEILPGAGIEAGAFWNGLAKLLDQFAARNRALLERRDELQSFVDRWYQRNGTETLDPKVQRRFLESIGYIVRKPEPFEISTHGAAREIAEISGPQLVVPADNARYAINAVNARWGSLYDALYGTNAIDAPQPQSKAYDHSRGAKVIAYGRQFLDQAVPLKNGSHADVVEYRIQNDHLFAKLADGRTVSLASPNQLAGWKDPAEAPSSVLLKNNGLHIEIAIDPFHPVGERDQASVCDIVLESAVTTIIDFEDSVAAVDAEDKCVVYRNWLGLCDGTLTAQFLKDGKPIERSLNSEKTFRAPKNEMLKLSGTSQMLVRNVGHLMMTDAVFDQHGRPAPEGLLDAYITGIIALRQYNSHLNSQAYVVKPKMHGPDEVAFAVDVFSFIEVTLGLPDRSLKIGIMDEERRTSSNLKACIAAARDRVIFINTGFLDRTADEIHTMMYAGPVLRKREMKNCGWMAAYETGNVHAGLSCGFIGKAQIGKGMWAMPDQMAEMLDEKIFQLKAGANTAWAPSPTAATLHALHYHEIDVKAVQLELSGSVQNYENHLLDVPIALNPSWSDEDIQAELNNNVQGILGYVARWVQHGVGCSKVLNIDGVGMMEDRATLRISSQLLANWLTHGVCTRDQIEKTFVQMARIVDAQNAHDPTYSSMSPAPQTSRAFQAALELVFEGRTQPNGYTEPILQKWRLAEKRAAQV